MPSLDLDPRFAYLLRLGDDNLVLAQRLGEWISRGPDLEEDIALGNIALDHLGVARNLLTYAGDVEGAGRDEDDLAMKRTEREFLNLILCEQPNRDFAHTMARQFFIDAWQVPLWEELSSSADATLAGIAQKAVKEARYHLRHSSTWVVRLGDGTDESHQRMQGAVDRLWRFTGEPFLADDVDEEMADSGIGVEPASLRPAWDATVDAVLAEAGLHRPDDEYVRAGGRLGFHSEHLGHLLAEMQWMQRTYPEMAW
ncbi:MAG TPA: 1,2-phenylacetyl-CoA epoxidase subunit PaaC [Acidimicrobiia bacterium]|jgi:ring-1,2-phenylacetyl-CoA epoxidase subunit PaaC|nr:1,2-phenylacetyl-CoA epoxidase subunit PaaC [Acidimicrobiia bacterium]